MNSRFLHFLLALMLLLAGLNAAQAAKPSYTASDRIVSAAELASAISSSPRLSQFLSGNIQSIVALGLGVESGGHTSVYNGLCCYGVLQMSDSNIRAYSRRMYGREFGGETYRNLPLQQQIDMWVNLTVDGESSYGFRELGRMAARGETFNNQPVDFAFRLACIQLGIGHCEDMVRSGRCDGFKGDANGVNICDMANAIRRRMGQQTYPYSGGGGSTRPIPEFKCRRNADGSCMSVSEAMRAAFREGSGVEMETLRKVLRILLMGTALLAAGSGTLTAWQSYSKGAIAMPAMVGYVKRATLLTLTVVVILSFM